MDGTDSESQAQTGIPSANGVVAALTSLCCAVAYLDRRPAQEPGNNLATIVVRPWRLRLVSSSRVISRTLAIYSRRNSASERGEATERQHRSPPENGN